MKVKAKIELEIDLEFSQDSIDDFSMFLSHSNENELLKKFVTNRAQQSLVIQQCKLDGVHEYKLGFSINGSNTKINQVEKY